MVKYFCDRCGAEVKERTFATVRVPYLSRYIGLNGEQCVIANDYVEKMLCTDCIDALQIFLEGESNGTNAI